MWLGLIVNSDKDVKVEIYNSGGKYSGKIAWAKETKNQFGSVISCKPTLTVSSDYDKSANFSGCKSFSLYYLISRRRLNQLHEERIWNSIRAEMTKKGYVENNRNPDLLVNALSVLENKEYISANSSFSGYGGACRPYGYLNMSRTGSGQTTFQAHSYEEGSLVIDIVDVNTNKLVCERIGNAEFEKRPKNPDEVISKAVNKILAGFPERGAK